MEIVAAATGNANADPTSSLKLIQDLVVLIMIH